MTQAPRGLQTERPLPGQGFDQGPNTCPVSNRSLSASWRNIDSSPDFSYASSDEMPTPRRMIRRAKAIGNAFVSRKSSHRSMRLGRAFGSPTSWHRFIGSTNLRVNARRLAKKGRTEEALQKALHEEQLARLVRRVDADSEAFARTKDEKNMLANRNVNLSLKLKESLKKVEKLEEANATLRSNLRESTRNENLLEGKRDLIAGELVREGTLKSDRSRDDNMESIDETDKDSEMPRRFTMMEKMLHKVEDDRSRDDNMESIDETDKDLRLKRRFTMMEKMLHKVEDQCDSLTRNLTKVSGEKELLEADCMKLKEQFQQVTQMQTETKEKLEKIEKKLLEVLHESASEKTRLGRRRIPKSKTDTGRFSTPPDHRNRLRVSVTDADDKIFDVISRTNSVHVDEIKSGYSCLITRVPSIVNQVAANSDRSDDDKSKCNSDTAADASIIVQERTEMISHCKCFLM
eukprot:CAMPEP_0185280856 /NCGR_PEP_ID=MMETSP1359-20130426/66384_1 /TAXON_ID=552665 /ORGANISM="Bigelowiella longifila, Strain CCMP242" /LENGTH=460 /DNA_ID=CAMNT_0027876201 /DNA_START=43 /DNA_END=1425 /DNA_ORIENTATION=-